MLHWLPVSIAWTACLLSVFGCAKVKPHADYARTADLIRQRVPTTQVYAPESDPVLSAEIGPLLTMDQALQRALLANREFQAAFADVGLAQADLVQSALWKNPTLALAGMFPEGGGRAKLSFGIAEDIADLWQIPVRKKIAQANLDETIFRVVNQAVDLAVNTRQAYHRLQSLRQGRQIALENIEIARRSDEAAQARFSAAQVGKIDVDLARASLLLARLALIDIARQIRVTEDDLALWMGLDRWPQTEIALDPWPAAMPAPDQAAAVQLALTERLDLQAQHRMVVAARQRVRQEWLKIFPMLELGFDLERSAARAMPGRTVGYDTLLASVKNGKLTTPNVQTRAQQRRQESFNINATLGPSIALALPLFDQNQAQIAKAVMQLEQEKRRDEGLAQRVQRDVRTALANYAAATQTAAFYREQLLPQLQENIETANASYRAGTTTIVATLDAQRSLVAATSDLNKVTLDQLQAQDELERALGGPLLWKKLSPTSQPSDSPEPSFPTKK